MPIHAHFLKGSAKRTVAPRLSADTFCIHCFRNLGASRSAMQRAKTEARHVCAEKVLAAQPDAPPPYN
jgi:hypothetical protein